MTRAAPYESVGISCLSSPPLSVLCWAVTGSLGPVLGLEAKARGRSPLPLHDSRKTAGAGLAGCLCRAVRKSAGPRGSESARADAGGFIV